MTLLIVSLLLLLLFSAIFSASETAYFSLTQEDFKKLKIEEIAKNEYSFLLIILLANLLVNTSFASLATFLSINLFSKTIPYSFLLTFTSIITTLIILFLGEIFPKIYANRSPVKIGSLILPLFKKMAVSVNPLTQYFNKIFIFRFLPKVEPFPTKEELKVLIDFGIENKELTKEEGEILYNLIELEERRANEIMTPRNKIFALNKDLPLKLAFEKIKENPKSRIPIYEGSIDNIIGVIYLKDVLETMLSYNFDHPANLKLENLRKPINFVSEIQKLPTIFEELRKKGVHLVLVVDEFGQVSGLVTLEDILEAIFGEIKDEYDFAEELPYIKVAENTYLLAGDIDLVTINRLTNNSLKEVKFPRLSLFLFEKLGRLPQEGDIIKEKNLIFEIKEVKNRQIKKVLLKIL